MTVPHVFGSTVTAPVDYLDDNFAYLDTTYATLALAEAATPASGTTVIFLSGYTTAGDGRGGAYGISSSPAAPGKFQTADGRWWKLLVTGLGVKPEQFGALGTGANDAVAFQAAMSFASAAQCPLILTGTSVYGLGSAGWVGLNVTSGHLSIIGNGATIRLLALPSQDIVISSTKSWFRLINTNNISVDNVIWDFNSLSVTGLLSSGGNDGLVTGCQSVNSGSGTLAAIFAWWLKGARFTAERNTITGGDFAFRTGHTSTGNGFDNVRLSKNIATGLAADFHACVGNDIFCHSNDIEGCFTGWALSGQDSTGATCRNVHIAHNKVIGFTAQGVQSDLVLDSGGITRLKNINVTDNDFGATTSGSHAFYMQNTDGFIFARNMTVTSLMRGVAIGNVTNGYIGQNQLLAIGESAILLDCSLGNIINVVIDANDCVAATTAAIGIQIASDATFFCTDVAVINNKTVTGFGSGLQILGTNHVGLSIHDDRVLGNTSDVECLAQDADIYNNVFVTDGGTFSSWPMDAPATGVVDMRGRREFNAAYGSGTNVSGMTGLVTDRAVNIFGTNANLTLVNSGTLNLKGATNVNVPANGYITLVARNGGAIYELSRSF